MTTAWHGCESLANVRANLRLSDVTDQPTHHRCQAQVTAAADQPVCLLIRQKVKPNGFTVEICAYLCGTNSPRRRARYPLTGSNEYMKVKQRHLSHGYGGRGPAQLHQWPPCALYEPGKVAHARLYATARSHSNLCVVGCGPS